MKKIISFSILATGIVLLIVLLSFLNPEEIVQKIGVKNGYILAIVVSFFGGFSAGGSITFISILATLALGGLNPIYLGLLSGSSLALGDMIMFYTFTQGRELITGKWDKTIDKITKIIKKKESIRRFIPLASYVYFSLIPLPNDILILLLAALKYPLRKLFPIILFGDVTFALIVTLFAAHTFFG
jgi:hypothetical protein